MAAFTRTSAVSTGCDQMAAPSPPPATHFHLQLCTRSSDHTIAGRTESAHQLEDGNQEEQPSSPTHQKPALLSAATERLAAVQRKTAEQVQEHRAAGFRTA